MFTVMLSRFLILLLPLISMSLVSCHTYDYAHRSSPGYYEADRYGGSAYSNRVLGRARSYSSSYDARRRSINSRGHDRYDRHPQRAITDERDFERYKREEEGTFEHRKRQEEKEFEHYKRIEEKAREHDKRMAEKEREHYWKMQEKARERRN